MGMNFSAMELKCINPCFEAATAPNQTREPVRIEDERPFPAFEFGNEWAKQYQVEFQTIVVLKPYICFIVIARNSWGN